MDLTVEAPLGSLPDGVVSCDFLVAADGANSGVRQALGIDMVGRTGIAQLMNIHFRTPP